VLTLVGPPDRIRPGRQVGGRFYRLGQTVYGLPKEQEIGAVRQGSRQQEEEAWRSDQTRRNREIRKERSEKL
jgi:hypothetical protein